MTIKKGRPKKYTYEMKLTEKQWDTIAVAIRTQGRIMIADFGLLTLTGIAKRKCYHPTFKKVISFPARRKINLRALGSFYKFIQTL